MILETQQKVFDEFTQSMRELMLKKGSDYSGADRLSNFKNAGAICGLTPEMNCLNLMATKVARLGQLLSSGTVPNNESIDDSLKDLANYTVLLYMLRVENDLSNYYITLQPSPNLGEHPVLNPRP